MEDRSERDVEEGGDPTLGANVEIGPSHTDVPEYGLSPGGVSWIRQIFMLNSSSRLMI